MDYTQISAISPTTVVARIKIENSSADPIAIKQLKLKIKGIATVTSHPSGFTLQEKDNVNSPSVTATESGNGNNTMELGEYLVFDLTNANFTLGSMGSKIYEIKGELSKTDATLPSYFQLKLDATDSVVVQSQDKTKTKDVGTSIDFENLYSPGTNP